MLGNNPPPYRGPTCCRAESLGCFLCRAVNGNFFTVPREGPCLPCLNAHLVQCLNRFLIVKRFALSGAFSRHVYFAKSRWQLYFYVITIINTSETSAATGSCSVSHGRHMGPSCAHCLVYS